MLTFGGCARRQYQRGSFGMPCHEINRMPLVARCCQKILIVAHPISCARQRALGSGLNTVRLAVRAEPVEAHSPFDKLRANELKRTALGQVLHKHIYKNGFQPIARQLKPVDDVFAYRLCKADPSRSLPLSAAKGSG